MIGGYHYVRPALRDAEFRLLLPGETPSANSDVESPTRKGLMLIRRLAPSAEDYAAVKALAVNASCAEQR